MQDIKQYLNNGTSIIDLFNKNDMHDTQIRSGGVQNRKDPSLENLSMSEFVTIIKDKLKLSSNETKIKQLADVIKENGKQKESTSNKNDFVNLKSIEDYALGFRQDNVKVFLFGLCH